MRRVKEFGVTGKKYISTSENVKMNFVRKHSRTAGLAWVFVCGLWS